MGARDALDPLGGLSGTVSAAVTRASWNKRVNPVTQPTNRVARLFAGRAAAPPLEEVLREQIGGLRPLSPGSVQPGADRQTRACSTWLMATSPSCRMEALLGGP